MPCIGHSQEVVFYIVPYHSPAPCPPENVKKSVVCDNRTVDISWSAVPGAVTYAATLEAINGGQQFCCTTSDTACDISELPCGEMYILVVVAEGRTCNSSQSEGELTMTGVIYTVHFRKIK